MVLQSDITQTERENQLEKLEAAKAAWLVCLSLLSLTASFLDNFKVSFRQGFKFYGLLCAFRGH